MHRSGKEHDEGFKHSPKCKVILEIYGDKFIDFEDEEIDIGALENEEGNYSEAQRFALKN